MIDIQDILDHKIKLEFGNKEQIKCIENWSERQKEIEEADRNFRVTFALSGTATIDVEAEDEDEAIEKARGEVGYDCIDDLDFDFIEIYPFKLD